VFYKLSHNGQVCYLVGALNDSFDPVERRIFITDAGGNDIVPIYPDSDLNVVVLNTDTDVSMSLQTDSGYTGGNYDFKVNLPYRYTDATTYQIKSLIDFYKLAGKRYDLIY
jgi:hypothetical protein